MAPADDDRPVRAGAAAGRRRGLRLRLREPQVGREDRRQRPPSGEGPDDRPARQRRDDPPHRLDRPLRPQSLGGGGVRHVQLERALRCGHGGDGQQQRHRHAPARRSQHASRLDPLHPPRPRSLQRARLELPQDRRRPGERPRHPRPGDRERLRHPDQPLRRAQLRHLPAGREHARPGAGVLPGPGLRRRVGSQHPRAGLPHAERHAGARARPSPTHELLGQRGQGVRRQRRSRAHRAHPRVPAAAGDPGLQDRAREPDQGQRPPQRDRPRPDRRLDDEPQRHGEPGAELPLDQSGQGASDDAAEHRVLLGLHLRGLRLRVRGAPLLSGRPDRDRPVARHLGTPGGLALAGLVQRQRGRRDRQPFLSHCDRRQALRAGLPRGRFLG